MGRGFDLLGDPIPEGRGEPGRTGHIATAENVSRVRLLLLAGLPKGRIADEVGISLPTLNKHYFASGKISARHAREMAVAEARATNVLRLDKAAKQGNVAAMRAMHGIIERAAVGLVDAAVSSPGRARVAKPRIRALPEGKKAAALVAAHEAEDEMDNLFGEGTRH